MQNILNSLMGLLWCVFEESNEHEHLMSIFVDCRLALI